METSDHPLPTPPSIPPDTYHRTSSSPRDPLSVSPVLSPPAVVDSLASDVRDQPPLPNAQSQLFPSSYTLDIPQADSSIGSDRPRVEPPVAMDVNQQPSTSEMVNGHKENGEYMAVDVVSGQTVESPEPTNEPTPPSTGQPVELASFAPPPPSLPDTKADIMEDVRTFNVPTKPIRGPPTSDEPPAKRLKTEPSPLSYDTSKKIPANQQKFLTALLRQVKKGKDATPFREPVDPIKLNIPRYFDIVTRPMDISTIEKKLMTGAYPVVQAVVDDFNLMIDNCVKFNGLENPVTKMGQNIQATFEKGMKTLPPEQVFSSFESF